MGERDIRCRECDASPGAPCVALLTGTHREKGEPINGHHVSRLIYAARARGTPLAQEPSSTERVPESITPAGGDPAGGSVGAEERPVDALGLPIERRREQQLRDEGGRAVFAMVMQEHSRVMDERNEALRVLEAAEAEIERLNALLAPAPAGGSVGVEEEVERKIAEAEKAGTGDERPGSGTWSRGWAAGARYALYMLRAALRAHGGKPGETGWRSMDSAPKDGSDILLCTSMFRQIIVGRWQDGAWRSAWDLDILAPCSRWMPLPAPPTPEAEQPE